MAKITGIVKWASDVQSGTSQAGNDWQRQEIMVQEITGEYPQSVVLTLMGSDRIEKFSEYVRTPKVGTFHFAMEAREYNGRYWNSMRLYRVDAVGAQTTQPAAAPAETEGTQDNNDGLPF